MRNKDYPLSINRIWQLNIKKRSQINNNMLLALTSDFFKNRGYSIEYNLKYEGVSGLLHKIDLVIKKGEEEHVILVMDWRRTVGVNMIIKAIKATEDLDLVPPIIVARRFSDHAKAYSNKKKIVLMTEKELH